MPEREGPGTSLSKSGQLVGQRYECADNTAGCPCTYATTATVDSSDLRIAQLYHEWQTGSAHHVVDPRRKSWIYAFTPEDTITTAYHPHLHGSVGLIPVRQDNLLAWVGFRRNLLPNGECTYP